MLERHRIVSRGREFVRVLLGLLLALVGCVSLLVIAGVDVGIALQAMWMGSFGTIAGLGSTLVKATPVVFTGLGAAIALKAGLFNVGGEGQLYVGGLLGTFMAISVGQPAALSIGIGIVMGFVGGALWGAIPGALRAYRGVNEIISTVLLNFVAIQLVNYFLGGPFREPGATDPHSSPVPFQLPRILPNTSANLGFVLALVSAAAVAYIVSRTSGGLQLRAIGGNIVAARYAGVPDRAAILASLTISGAFAGGAGAVEVIGFQHRLYQGFSPGYGFEGLLAAIIAKGDAWMTVVFAVLLGGLRSGGEEMQRATGVPVDFVFIVQAVVILILASARGIRRQPSARSRDLKKSPESDIA